MILFEHYAEEYARLVKRSRHIQNEAEVRSAWITALEGATGLTFDLERGRRDSSYNNVIIEFKDMGLFSGRANSPAFLNATTDRLPWPSISFLCARLTAGVPV